MTVHPPVIRRAAPVILAVLCAASAASANCPTAPVVEEGGEHWCYSAGARGNVHLWTPAGYDPKTSVTVVYVHGHDIDAPKRGAKHYLDWAWSAHGLAKGFAGSGIGALFVAIEGPVNDRQKVKWKSLDALLRSVKKDGGVAPPKRVIAAAHSAGVFTLLRWLDDGRLTHAIVLDALYLDSADRLARWYRGSKSRRLTLVGADSVGWRAAKLSKKLRCASGLGSKARCAALVDLKLGHMDVVTDGTTLPAALARIRR